MFLIVGFVMAGISINNMLSEQNAEIQADPNMAAEAKAVMSTATAQMPSLIDGGFIFLLFGIWIWLIVSSLFIESHPAFFVIGIIAMVIVVIMGANLANAYDEFILQSPDLAATAANYSITNFVMGHFIETILIIIFSVVITLYTKSRLE